MNSIRNGIAAACLLLALAILYTATTSRAAEARADSRPNILFCFSDDQSWPHMGAYGDKVVKTPVFDRVAREGVLFNYAYCGSPSCTPSRSAVLTGQQIWRLGEGAQLFGTLPVKHPVYTNILAGNGYVVGWMAKGWAPGSVTAGGHKHNPAGKMQVKNFKQFMDAVGPAQPWCFWFGSRDPHRGYRKGRGVASGMDPNAVEVPPVFPDTPEVRSDICDYYFEIQRFDREIGEMLKLIEAAGQMDNTIVVITSDNGMPFPRAKANLYDLGARMPLAISWSARVKGGRRIDDFVSLTDLAPTFLEAAGIAPPESMTGRSLMKILRSNRSGLVDKTRDCVFSARERHAWCRIDGKGYPSRMVRTHDLMYIRNYEPGRWPAGTHRIRTNEGHCGDVDASPTKNVMFELKGTRLYELSFGKRPREELYDCSIDPFQMRNLADDPAYGSAKRMMSRKLTEYLRKTGDPREVGGKVMWDEWRYYGRSNWPVLPE